MIDLVSILGYRSDSPFRSNPYLDIHTPSGIIDMSGTKKDLIGYTPQGEVQLMKAGRKNPYKFSSSMVREIPLQQAGGLFNTNKQGYVDSVLGAHPDLDWVHRLYESNTPSIQLKGEPYPSTHLMADDGNGYVFPSIVRINGKLQYLGNRAEDYARESHTGIQLPKQEGTWFAANGYKKGTGVLNRFQYGGNPYSAQNLYDFLFDEDDTDESSDAPTAPSSAELEAFGQEKVAFEQQKRDFQQQQEDQYALSLALQPSDEEQLSTKKRYPSFNLDPSNNPYKAGQYGQEIISNLTQALGYTPQFNSVYRTPEKQQQLIQQGYGVPNSFHLTGDAVDLKPQDWQKLSKSQQQSFRSNYDVIYHNNHYHLEPKGVHRRLGGRINPFK